MKPMLCPGASAGSTKFWREDADLSPSRRRRRRNRVHQRQHDFGSGHRSGDWDLRSIRLGHDDDYEYGERWWRWLPCVDQRSRERSPRYDFGHRPVRHVLGVEQLFNVTRVGRVFRGLDGLAHKRYRTRVSAMGSVQVHVGEDHQVLLHRSVERGLMARPKPDGVASRWLERWVFVDDARHADTRRLDNS